MAAGEIRVQSALESPDEIRQSRTDPEVLPFYRLKRPSVGPARWSSRPAMKRSWLRRIPPTRSRKASEYGRTEGVPRQGRQDTHSLVHRPIPGVRLRRDGRRSRPDERPRWASHRFRKAQLLRPRFRFVAHRARNYARLKELEALRNSFARSCKPLCLRRSSRLPTARGAELQARPGRSIALLLVILVACALVARSSPESDHADRNLPPLPAPERRAARQPFHVGGLLQDRARREPVEPEPRTSERGRVHDQFRAGEGLPALRGVRGPVQQGRRRLGAQELLAQRDRVPAAVRARGVPAVAALEPGLHDLRRRGGPWRRTGQAGVLRREHLLASRRARLDLYATEG